MRFHPEVPHGYCKRRLRDVRARRQLRGYLEIHHVVPRELRAHPVLREARYDVEECYNTILLPSATAPARLRLRDERVLHAGGHMKYNAFVREGLDACGTFDAFLALLVVCHRGSRGLVRVPWR